MQWFPGASKAPLKVLVTPFKLPCVTGLCDWQMPPNWDDCHALVDLAWNGYLLRKFDYNPGHGLNYFYADSLCMEIS